MTTPRRLGRGSATYTYDATGAATVSGFIPLTAEVRPLDLTEHSHQVKAYNGWYGVTAEEFGLAEEGWTWEQIKERRRAQRRAKS